MKTGSTSPRHATQASFFAKQDKKELPIAFNVSSTNYVSLRIKKKFIDRYLISKQVSQNCRTSQQSSKGKTFYEEVNNTKKPLNVSPVKINQNSPELLRERIKTEYPKVRFFRRQRKDNLKSVYKAVTVEFLQQKTLPQAKPNKFKINKLSSFKKSMQTSHRPMTANENLKLSSKSSSIRRTKTLQVTALSSSTNGKYQVSHSIRGWQNEVPEYFH